MLNIYLVPKKQSNYIPNERHLRRWFTELHSSALAQCLSGPLEQSLAEFDRVSSLTLEFSSDLNTHHLYNQDAHEALMPAELSFESMSLNISTHATLLPLDEIEFEAFCSHCGDSIIEQDFDLAVAKLDIFPLSKIQVSCISCQEDWPLKSLSFEPEMSFAKFWISIQQSASTRLNALVIKAWEKSLGCELLQLDVNFDDSQTLAADDLNQDLSFWDDPTAGTSQGRKDYRQSRWSKKQQGKTRSKKKNKPSQMQWRKRF